ncbi:ATP-dependent DNA helicase PIF1 [Corchorus olitorius]|uniref:ATP-dependent DNA helicase PIF1 n=1 Tax=Corchorus olitorius TaxID=93759 RepID=A0A1R3KWW2_9ROSI|nr:ATP-dependent DNA helicase PIF1 [Corchorus olitorius]
MSYLDDASGGLCDLPLSVSSVGSLRLRPGRTAGTSSTNRKRACASVSPAPNKRCRIFGLVGSSDVVAPGGFSPSPCVPSAYQHSVVLSDGEMITVGLGDGVPGHISFPALSPDLGSRVSPFVGPSGTGSAFSAVWFSLPAGMVSLPPRQATPLFLDGLLDPRGGPLSRSFRDNIRVYNSLFQFTSLGGGIDNSVNVGSGPYIFRLNHQTYHKIGPLFPDAGHRLRFAQLFIYDCANEVSNRVYSVAGNRVANNVNTLIVEGLMMMFDSCNEVVKLFRPARERMAAEPSQEVRIRLIRSRGSDARTYSVPTSTQIDGLIVGDFGQSNGDRDVIVQQRWRAQAYRDCTPTLHGFAISGFVPLR